MQGSDHVMLQQLCTFSNQAGQASSSGAPAMLALQDTRADTVGVVA